MKVTQAFRFELDPNNKAASQLSSHCGASRFAYNTMLAYVHWALDARAFEKRTTGVSTTQVSWNLYALRKVWNTQVKSWVAPWWKENSKESYNSGFDALARALDAFSKSREGQRAGKRIGFPRFKGRAARRSYRVTTGAFGLVDARHVKIPRIGSIRTKEPTSALLGKIEIGAARILSATVSHEAQRWFVSFGCEIERHDLGARSPDVVVGVDVGVHHLAVLSTGDIVDNPKAATRYQRRMARLQSELSRRQRNSKRRTRTKAQLARYHRKVANVRSDALHKLTTDLANTFGTVVIEDLNVAGMTAATRPKIADSGGYVHNGRAAKAGLNRSVLDAAPGEFRRQLTYKLQ